MPQRMNADRTRWCLQELGVDMTPERVKTLNSMTDQQRELLADTWAAAFNDGWAKGLDQKAGEEHMHRTLTPNRN